MKDINAPPINDFDRCIGCGQCVGICPGLAIFMIKELDDTAYITLPYEFLPIPQKGDLVEALNRKGEKKQLAKVVQSIKKGKTAVVTIEVEKKHIMDIRHIRVVK